MASQDYTTLPGPPSSTFAHEIGHNFGFRHDNVIENKTKSSCGCDDPEGKCIMYSSARLVPSHNSLVFFDFSISESF